MTNRKLLDYAITAMAGWTVVQVGGFFTTQDLWVAHIVPPIVAVVTFICLHKLEDLLVRNNRPVRRLLIPVANLEGRWINRSNRFGHDHYGIFDLTYDKEKERHFVNGQSFIDSGKQAANWHSWPVHFDSQKLRLEYRFSGESKTKALSEGTSEILKIDGWSVMNFNRSDRNSGEGYFINFQPEPVKRDFTLERMTDVVIAQLQTTADFPPDSDIQKALHPGSG